METNSITKELNSAFVEFKQDHKGQLEKQTEQLQKQHEKLDKVEETVDALIEKMTKMPGAPTTDNGYKTKNFEQYLRTGDIQVLQKSMQIATDASGGVLHVPELADQIVAAVGQIIPLMSEVKRISIGANKFEEVYTTSRNANARAGEGDTRAETATANFEKNEIELYDLFSYPVVTNELRNSNAFNLDGWLRQDVTEAFSEALAVEFVSGNGVKQSTGLLNSTSADTIGGTPALPWGTVHKQVATTSIDYGDLLGVISALPVRYKAAGNVRWYAGTAAIESIRGLVDANDLPLWRQDHGIVGSPQTLLGYAVTELPQLDDTDYPLLFGDMKQAYRFVVHNRGLGVLIDPYTMAGHTRFYISLQCNGGLGDSRAVVALELAE